MKNLKFNRKRLSNIMICITGVLAFAAPFYKSFNIYRIIPEFVFGDTILRGTVKKNMFGAAAEIISQFFDDKIILCSFIMQIMILFLFFLSWVNTVILLIEFLRLGFGLKIDSCDRLIGTALDMALLYLSIIIMTFTTSNMSINPVFLTVVLSQLSFVHMLRKADAVF